MEVVGESFWTSALEPPLLQLAGLALADSLGQCDRIESPLGFYHSPFLLLLFPRLLGFALRLLIAAHSFIDLIIRL
jgi:hypothetical protein